MQLAAGELDPRVAVDGDEGGRLVAGVEEGVLAADLQDVGVFGRHPERVEALDIGLAKRVVGPQPAEGVVDRRILGVGLGRDHGAGDIVWNA